MEVEEEGAVEGARLLRLLHTGSTGTLHLPIRCGEQTALVLVT